MYFFVRKMNCRRHVNNGTNAEQVGRFFILECKDSRTPSFFEGWFSVLAEVVLPACPCMEEPRPF